LEDEDRTEQATCLILVVDTKYLEEFDLICLLFH